MIFCCFKSFLAMVIAALLASCGDGSGGPAGTDDPFLSVSTEEGGFCGGKGPCWWRTVVTSDGMIWLERPTNAALSAELTSVELADVAAIVNASSFRRLISASSSTCPVVFDFGVGIVIKTIRMEARDNGAGGCVLNMDTHPYTKLKTLLDTLAAKYFPNALK